MNRSIKLMVAAALALLLVGGAAWAIASDSATIQACVDPATGSIRIVADISECVPPEEPLVWNIVGPPGPPGPPGPEGPPAVSGYERVSASFDITLASGARAQRVVECPAGKVVLGGGYRVQGPRSALIAARHSYPPSDSSWRALVQNFGGSSASFTLEVWAVCMSAP